MTITGPRILAAAWALWRRDRDLLVRIGVPFILLPSMALQLLVPHAPLPANTATADVFRLQWQFTQDHLGAYVLALGLIEYGHAALFALYVDARAGDVRGVLRRAAVAWPRFVLLAMLVELFTFGGLLFFVAGRLLPAGAALVGEPGTSTVGAVRRAIALTTRQTILTSAIAAALLAGRLLLLWPFAAMDDWLRSLGAPNPVALAIVDGAGAGANMLVTIAGVLVAVVLYRALSSMSTRASTGI